jgi:preprotein translocase subunit SecY
MRQAQATPRGRSERPALLQAMIDAFQVPDLRARLLFTLAMLVAFRFVAQVPVPGVDHLALQNLFRQQGVGDILGMLNLFSGGALEFMSVAAMGVYPYITASIIMQVLTPLLPRLKALSQEGDAGRQRLNQFTHWLTVPVAALQGYGQLVIVSNAGVIGDMSLLPTVSMVFSFVAGTMFLVWLGELITERGIGNGISLIIFAGIVAGLPTLLREGAAAQGQPLNLLFFAALWLAVIFIIVLFNEALRRIPVQYGRSVFRGGQVMRSAGTTYLPIRVNSAGMIPIIFALSVVTLPGIIASYFSDPLSDAFVPRVASFLVGIFNGTGPFYWILLFILVVIFAFFYTFIIFQQQNLPENLQRNGGFIPGIRPGNPTRDYLNRVIIRVTWAGALFLGAVAISPYLITLLTDIRTIGQSSILSGTALLIMVGVALDTMRQLEAQLTMRRYEGFIR